MDTFAQKHIFGLSTVMCGDKIKLQIAQVKNILCRDFFFSLLFLQAQNTFATLADPQKPKEEIVWNGTNLTTKQRVLHSEFEIACHEKDDYINCSAFDLFSPKTTVTHNDVVVVEDKDQTIAKAASSVRWFYKLKHMALQTRFCLSDQIKRALSLEMEAHYLTGCNDEKTYRYLRVCLLIAFEACVKRAENLCMMHMLVHDVDILSNFEVIILMKLFDFREITDHIVNHGTYPPTMFDVV